MNIKYMFKTRPVDIDIRGLNKYCVSLNNYHALNLVKGKLIKTSNEKYFYINYSNNRFNLINIPTSEISKFRYYKIRISEIVVDDYNTDYTYYNSEDFEISVITIDNEKWYTVHKIACGYAALNSEVFNSDKPELKFPDIPDDASAKTVEYISSIDGTAILRDTLTSKIILTNSTLIPNVKPCKTSTVLKSLTVTIFASVVAGMLCSSIIFKGLFVERACVSILVSLIASIYVYHELYK